MLRSITFQSGTSQTQSQLTVPLTPVTVFVGPNNSGKSRALVEIEKWVKEGEPRAGQVIKQIEFEPWDQTEFELELAKIEATPTDAEQINPEAIIVEKIRPQENQSARFGLDRRHIISEATNPNGNSARYSYAGFLSLYTLRLDGQSRLSLVSSMPAGDLLAKPANLLAKLFTDGTLRKEIRRIASDAFTKYLVIDPTNIGHLRIRLSNRPPQDDAEEQGWDERSRSFHSEATAIDQFSDGVKAFVGILTSIIAGEPKITLIDEPEAFLHPSLSSRLAKEISTALMGTNKRLFAATHSSSFLMGCIQSGVPVNIVRLTYDGSTATSRLLAQDKLIALMRNPLLRSIGVLNALFHSAVVVTEADADRAFYQEINERLLQSGDSRGIPDCLFLNAQNKQTVWDIVQPLRELGIPAVGIVDIDVLKDSGANWTKPMHGAFIPDITHHALGIQRQSILKAFNDTGKDFKRDGGVSVLSKSEKEACECFLTHLSEYGMFVVPTGEVESWLQSIPLNRGKATWLNTVFEAMGEDPNSSDYVRPGPSDVWGFIGGISAWVQNPQRKGLPA